MHLQQLGVGIDSQENLVLPEPEKTWDRFDNSNAIMPEAVKNIREKEVLAMTIMEHLAKRCKMLSYGKVRELERHVVNC